MGSARKLLDWFDPVFADSFTCFLPPPYDTANEVNDKLKEVFDKLDKKDPKEDINGFIIDENRQRS